MRRRIFAGCLASLLWLGVAPQLAEARRKAPEPVQRTPIPASEVFRAIHVAAQEFGVDEQRMLSIGHCESRFDPYAGRRSYKGVFQQSVRYWPGRVREFNLHHDPDVAGDIFNPFDNARVSARMMAARGGMKHWRQCLR